MAQPPLDDELLLLMLEVELDEILDVLLLDDELIELVELDDSLLVLLLLDSVLVLLELILLVLLELMLEEDDDRLLVELELIEDVELEDTLDVLLLELSEDVLELERLDVDDEDELDDDDSLLVLLDDTLLVLELLTLDVLEELELDDDDSLDVLLLLTEDVELDDALDVLLLVDEDELLTLLVLLDEIELVELDDTLLLLELLLLDDELTLLVLLELTEDVDDELGLLLLDELDSSSADARISKLVQLPSGVPPEFMLPVIDAPILAMFLWPDAPLMSPPVVNAALARSDRSDDVGTPVSFQSVQLAKNRPPTVSLVMPVVFCGSAVRSPSLILPSMSPVSWPVTFQTVRLGESPPAPTASAMVSPVIAPGATTYQFATPPPEPSEPSRSLMATYDRSGPWLSLSVNTTFVLLFVVSQLPHKTRPSPATVLPTLTFPVAEPPLLLTLTTNVAVTAMRALLS
jgi:hypothetical protein